MDSAKPLLAFKIQKLKTLTRPEIGAPVAEVEKLSDFTEAFRWCQHFIYAKLCRAIASRASEELKTEEE